MACEVAVVIPVYNSQNTIGAVVRSVLAEFRAREVPCRVILVDDCSADESARAVDELARADDAVMAIHLAHNYGQQAALLCGLRHAGQCRYVLTMDDDLQHDAQTALALYDKIREGYDLVYAIPNRPDRFFFRRLGSSLRDAFFSLCARIPKGVKVGAFRILSADLAAKIAAEQRPFVYLSASAFRYAPKAANIAFTRPPRASGESGYTARKLADVYFKLLRHYTFLARLFPPGPAEPVKIRYCTERVSQIWPS